MPNRQMSSIRIRKNLVLFLSFLPIILTASSCSADNSYLDTHTIINKTDKRLLVTFFRGYPINKVVSQELNQGENLRVEDMVSRPTDIYLITAVDIGSGEKLVYKKFFNLNGLMKLYEMDAEKKGILIRNEDLE